MKEKKSEELKIRLSERDKKRLNRMTKKRNLSVTALVTELIRAEDSRLVDKAMSDGTYFEYVDSEIDE